MKKCLLLLLPVVIGGGLMAQSYFPDKVDKKIANLYTQAISAAESGQFKQGISILDKAI